jgi:hypothetical protein
LEGISKWRKNQRELVLMGIMGRYSRLEELGYRAYSSLSSYEWMERAYREVDREIGQTFT